MSSPFLVGPISEYTLGDVVRLYTPTPFTDENGEPADPTELEVTVWRHGDDPITYALDEDPEVINVDSEPGMYRLDFQPPLSGYWFHRWYARGTVTAALEGRFRVVSRHGVTLNAVSVNAGLASGEGEAVGP